MFSGFELNLIPVMKKLVLNLKRHFISAAASFPHSRADALIAQGHRLEDAKKFTEALEHYRAVVQLDPLYPRAHLNVGNARLALDCPEGAITCFRKAISLNPRYSQAYFNLANVLQGQKRHGEAIDTYREVLQQEPFLTEAYLGLANTLEDLGKIEQAIKECRTAVAFSPGHGGAHFALGRLLLIQNKHAEAVVLLERALILNPGAAETSSLLADALLMLGAAHEKAYKQEEAIACARRTLELKLHGVEAHLLLGGVRHKQMDLEAAISHFHQALSLEPENAIGLRCLAGALRDRGDTANAMAYYKASLKSQPDHPETRWALAMAQVPVMLDSQDDIEEIRCNYAHELEQLDAWFTPDYLPVGYKAVGQHPFYLAYHERNNRDLMGRYGSLSSRLMNAWLDQQELVKEIRRAPGGRIRLAIVSSHVHNHSVWHALTKGWLRHMDNSRFEIYLFHTGSVLDSETSWAKSQVARYENNGESFSHWVDIIRKSNPDILIFPEIGMDNTTLKLASLRLAPVQIMGWGHPETSGLPTMDYFLSAEDLEPPLAEKNYTEKLHPLPGLGCCYDPTSVLATFAGWSALGLDQEAAIFLCPGTPFKYLPQSDWIFVEIAKRLGSCQFVFFSHVIREQSEKLRLRLEDAFAKANIPADKHVVFLPWQEKSSFYGLMQHATAMLDTIGFSGFNTAMQAIECTLPVVAWEGRFLRGRLASGILRHMGLTELITTSSEDYINLAIRLARSGDFRASICKRIETYRSRLYNSVAPITALQDFLIEVAQRRDKTSP